MLSWLVRFCPAVSFVHLIGICGLVIFNDQKLVPSHKSGCSRLEKQNTETNATTAQYLTRF